MVKNLILGLILDQIFFCGLYFIVYNFKEN